MRRTSTLISVVLSMALILSFVAVASEVEIKEVPVTWHQAALSDGQELYVELCASCHGVNADGLGPAAPALAGPVPDLTALAMGNGGVFPSEEVQKAIKGEGEIAAHGSLEMPVWGRVFSDLRPDHKHFRRVAFARQQIFNLSEYLESVQVVDKNGD